MPSATSRNYHAAMHAARLTRDPTYAALLAAVCERPEDHAAKLVLADWLEECGNPECEAWRWLWAWCKHPQHWLHVDTKHPWAWCCDHYINKEYPQHVLPNAVSDFLPLRDKYQFIKESAEQAYEDAVTAFLAARSSGWTPQWPDSPRG